MPALKHSKQRDAIKDFLSCTTSHPTADTVYMHVKEDFPNISLGTVYRNLNLLTDLGEAIKITTPDGGVRFDGTVKPHSHLYCKNCKGVFDLPFPYLSEIDEKANAQYGGQIDSHTILFYGDCETCASKKHS